MRPYQVTGSAVQISPGERLVLNPSQIASRRHQVKEVEKVADDAIVVESLALLNFKVGEIIGLKEVPKHARERLIDLQATEGTAVASAEGAASEAPHKSRRR